jgi:hypothetical protein
MSNISLLLKKYPDRVPTILKTPDKHLLNYLKYNKFLVPKKATIIEFSMIIRKKIKLDNSQALFLFIDNKNSFLPKPTSTFEELFNQYKNDNHLVLIYTTENAFG